ncbi:glycoside hydrolase family 9 protein [Chitinophaga pendula]|uniref:glycoside hydrolase family 9 protein n=1 Tax=Chitinophaga TaxID=79328 RepID=UPI000BB0A523|nr:MULTISPECIES: glycoside hydrolase family 9 protein [Chitinophaga]ASZ10095.1 cellulase [Chitinophaga sp. MD30]UCJ06952.1 glycoside hydrolase family 9 protein [Chitinophaga pendula]
MRTCYCLLLLAVLYTFPLQAQSPPIDAWIRINQLGYTPQGIKVAVLGTKSALQVRRFSLHDAATGRKVWQGSPTSDFGAYGPFTHTWRLPFTSYIQPGRYYLEAAGVRSPAFRIDAGVYKGTADYCLQYMRQQRCGYNPFLRDSCHMQDGCSIYGPLPDGTRIDATGGWHDATDYLQYVTTSANTTFLLLSAYRDFRSVFTDRFAANGLPGANGTADMLDEARWGLEWLLKMNPADTLMYNQIADDRDHSGLRLPNEDTVSYGYGHARPVYFALPAPQGLKQHKNRSTGLASTAGKFASAFALGSLLYQTQDTGLSARLAAKAKAAYRRGLAYPGVCQTAPCRAPYFYEEDNWKDDMELAAAALHAVSSNNVYATAAIQFAREEPLTPWMGADTARHYQWYPFHNIGHYELALQQLHKQELMGYYRQAIKKVWDKARHNAFYRGIPFIWCSNNLTTAFAIQCNRYRSLTGDTGFNELEQACIDWLLGCNPWGTTMVVDLPHNGDTPADPHSALSALRQYSIAGGLVDGPVYGSIYRNLLGIKLLQPDEYAGFQSPLAVYHDDFGDYSTNEPTLDGTASLIYLLAALESEQTVETDRTTVDHGAIVRGDTCRKKLALVFTADEQTDGAGYIRNTLRRLKVKASFFFTGRTYRQSAFASHVRHLLSDGHYLGPHSDQHLLYCDWQQRDSLLITRQQFDTDLRACQDVMHRLGIPPPGYFLPPYEWHNDTIAAWTRASGLQLVNQTARIGSAADYTWPEMGARYKSCDTIMERIQRYERSSAAGLNGAILLLHLGTDPRRSDKCYHKLEYLIGYLRQAGYELVTIPQLLNGRESTD